jgi:hypothetical protein
MSATIKHPKALRLRVERWHAEPQPDPGVDVIFSDDGTLVVVERAPSRRTRTGGMGALLQDDGSIVPAWGSLPASAVARWATCIRSSASPGTSRTAPVT